SRAEAFASIDRPAMKPLPERRYEYAEWLKAKVGIDYHVEADGHYYSVPHQLVGHYMHVRMSTSAIECLFKGRRVAAHVRSHQRGAHTNAPRAHARVASSAPAVDAGPALGLGRKDRRRHP